LGSTPIPFGLSGVEDIDEEARVCAAEIKVSKYRAAVSNRSTSGTAS
jgi:hypothetical protein